MDDFEGSAYFRQRIVCSTLSGKPIQINHIRSMEEHPGLNEYEASLLRLMDKLTNGTVIQIDVTGTSIYYRPGFIVGGKVSHNCGNDRSIGYFLEAIVVLAPFSRKPFNLTLTGITNHYDNLDISVDLFRVATLPLLSQFGIEGGLEFKIKRRGAPPNGGGEVLFKCPVIRERLTPINLVDEGVIKNIRGIVYTARMSPQVANRIREVAKGVLLEHVNNVFIYTDHHKGKDAGLSPGYGLSLVAESTTGTLLTVEKMGEGGQIPEDLGEYCANLLLHEILRGGCVDTLHQSIMLLLMALGPEDVSILRVGKLSPYTIEYLRNIKLFLGVQFSIETDPETKSVILSCRGSGYGNIARQRG
eukprot:TRINITY_DN764_c0_g1_i1.p1 TRINITY_DN764_c0_g1~~TRINITY_DN764_c0_g1_i1.p1  ORF type:complete len:359 (+),score=66.74 TRINITY_DN764_c0_g1_i1:43-1119(+)